MSKHELNRIAAQIEAVLEYTHPVTGKTELARQII
jgi:hypothetical protein